MRLWDVATGQQLGPLLAHPGGVERLVFSPDGREVVASGYVGADAVRLMRFGPEGNVGEWTMTVRRWAVPGRWEGEDKGVESWAAAVTGMELDVHDNVVVLDKAGWEDRRKQSQERGNR